MTTRVNRSILFVFVALAGLLHAQDASPVVTPKRGFDPNAVYSMGDIDTIDMASGTVTLAVPLVKLPPAPGGLLSGGVSMYYSSKLWETDPLLNPGPPHPEYHLIPSSQGGWIYGFGYTLEYGSDSVSYSMPCDQIPIRMIFPDGSRHALYNNFTGGQPSCLVAESIWYSLDGSFLRLQLHSAQSLVSWTLFLPDGSKVDYDYSGARLPHPKDYETITDRNGNVLELSTDTNSVNSNPQKKITDAAGRTIVIEYDSANQQDYVSAPGPAGSTLQWTIHWTSYTPVNAVYIYSNAPSRPTETITSSLREISSIVLPNNQSYGFSYGGKFGELTGITFPTGGITTLSYQLDTLTQTPNWNTVFFNAPTQKTVAYHDEYEAGTCTIQGVSGEICETWSYSFPLHAPSVPAGVVTSSVTAPDGGTTTSYFVGITYTGVPYSMAGMIFKVVKPDGSIVERNWQQNVPYRAVQDFYTGEALDPPEGNFPNGWVSEQLSTDANASGAPTITSSSRSSQDKNGNSTGNTVYDYATFSALHDASQNPIYGSTNVGPVLRSTARTMKYATPDSSDTTTNTPSAYTEPAAPTLFHLPSTVSIGTVQAVTYGYDGNGNMLSETTSGVSPSVTRQWKYDLTGNVTDAIDGNNRTTHYVYGSNSCPSGVVSGLYPTTEQRAYQTSVEEDTTYVYDCNTGMVASSIDPNSVQTTNTYDPYGRLQSSSVAGAMSHYSYDDVNRTVRMQHDITTPGDAQNVPCSTCAVTIHSYDQRGREWLSRQFENPAGSSEVDVQTRYLLGSAGHFRLQSNPYRPAGTDDTAGWTVTGYDRSGQVVSTAYYAGSAVPSVWPGGTNSSADGTATNGYDADATSLERKVTVADESTKTKVMSYDGLSNLVQVYEDPTALQYATCYVYDQLGDLLEVHQGGALGTNGRCVNTTKSRMFTYDQLRSLTRATNPESGTVNYTYDPAGNLSTKTSPAPNQTGSATVTTNYTYDALNRLTKKTYSDGTTPYAQFFYDGPCANCVGRLTGTWDGANTGTNYTYDPMGRTASTQDCAQPVCNTSWWTTYTYDLAGNIREYTIPTTTNPSGPPSSFVALNQSFDSAGRVTQLTSNLVDAQHPATLATVDPSVGYYPTGAIRKLTLGNGLAETAAYNSRLQPCRMNVNYTGGYYSHCTDAAPSGNVLDFTYGFNAGTNNGNIASWSATGKQTFSRTYTYDSLNRIATMADSASSQPCKGLSWTIDRWGNRTDQNVNAGACNPFHQTVDTTSNRFLGAPYQYDAAGNMIHDASHSYTYDAENRLIQVDGGALTYHYDPSGRRVAKTIGGTTWDYVYDLAGNVLFEAIGGGVETAYVYFAGALHAQYKGSTTYFLHRDHLGSTRLVTGVGTQIANGGFEQGLTGWSISGSTAQLITDPTRAHSGSNYVQLSTPANGIVGIQTGLVAVNPGDQVAFGGWAYLESGSASAAPLGWWLGVLDGNHNPVAYVSSSPVPSSAWTYESGTYTVPSNGAYVGLYAQIYQPSASTVLRVDDAFLANGRTATTVDNLDYLPFGEQIAGDTGTTHKFTSKERDAETGLDYFFSRYYSGAQGRYTSPDAPLIAQNEQDPQSWNLYTYGLNNPLRFTDPDGHEPCENGINPETGNICTTVTAPNPKPKPEPVNPGQVIFGGIKDLWNIVPMVANAMYFLGEHDPNNPNFPHVRMPYWQPSNQSQQRGQLISASIFLLAGRIPWLRPGSAVPAGETLYHEFQTAQGAVEMLADPVIQGNTLWLKDIAVYPKGTETLEIGAAAVREMRNELTEAAKQLGFTEVRITGTRLTGANPGKQVDLVIKIK